MIFIYVLLFVSLFVVFGVIAELHFNSMKKLRGNIWMTEDGNKFMITGHSLNRDAPYPVQIKFIEYEWVDSWEPDDKRFYRWVGNKKSHPEMFL